jgi:gas vesicle protein
MSENGNVAGFGMGIIVGAAIGLAIGILYAPHSGQETRSLLKEKAQEAEGKAEEILAAARQRAKKIIDDAKGHATEFKPEEETSR